MENLFKYTKVCTVCNQEKGLCDFVIQKGKPQARCRECNNKMAKEHFQNSFLATKQGSPWFNVNSIKFDVKRSLRDCEV